MVQSELVVYWVELGSFCSWQQVCHLLKEEEEKEEEAGNPAPVLCAFTMWLELL